MDVSNGFMATEPLIHLVANPFTDLHSQIAPPQSVSWLNNIGQAKKRYDYYYYCAAATELPWRRI